MRNSQLEFSAEGKAKSKAECIEEINIHKRTREMIEIETKCRCTRRIEVNGPDVFNYASLTVFECTCERRKNEKQRREKKKKNKKTDARKVFESILVLLQAAAAVSIDEEDDDGSDA